ncbi:MAG: hypothetical protein ACI398_02525 [Clostridium sp.]
MKRVSKNKIIGASLAAIAALGGTVVLKNKIKKIKKLSELESSIYINGRIRKLGTLYLDDSKKNISEDPEEIITYEGGTIEIRNSERNDSKIPWVEIEDDNKKLLVCSQNLIKNVSWDELNKQNLAYGKVIKLEGKKYLLRLLSGYAGDSTENSSEWDKYILNTDKIEGLPLSTDEDKNNTIKEYEDDKIESENNTLWNWRTCCSFTQSEYGKGNKFCIIRGLYSTTYNNYCDKEIAYDTVAYRPVLELVE